jgi:hypothetical protein
VRDLGHLAGAEGVGLVLRRGQRVGIQRTDGGGDGVGAEVAQLGGRHAAVDQAGQQQPLDHRAAQQAGLVVREVQFSGPLHRGLGARGIEARGAQALQRLFGAVLQVVAHHWPPR